MEIVMKTPPHEPPLVLESKPLEISEEIGSTEATILAALMEDSTNKIGIVGAGGVGRTRMVSRIGERVKREKVFKTVIMVRVGPRCDDAEGLIAYEIYHYLGVGLGGGDVVVQASELLSGLVGQGIRVLIILDDVWGVLNLERAGIPKDSCNLMIVSRFEEVCLGMGCDAIFELQNLMDEEGDDDYDDDILREKYGSSNNGPRAGIHMKRFMLHDSLLCILEELFGGTRSLYERKAMDVSSSVVAVTSLHKLQVLVALTSLPELQVLDVMSLPILRNLITLLNLDIGDSDIFPFPVELKNFMNLRLLNLTNCVYCKTIEYGVISSLIHLEELYMLGSFSDWGLAKEGEQGVNASIDELESLSNLIALQIEIQDPNIFIGDSVFLRLISFVISQPGVLVCRYEESLNVSFPAVENPWIIVEANLMLNLPSVTSFRDWMPPMLTCAERLHLYGDGSKRAIDGLIPDGLKFLEKLYINCCNTMEYLVDGIVPISKVFRSLEKLVLCELPLFKEFSNSEFVVDLLWELRDLKQFAYSTVVDLYKQQSQGFCFSRLKSVYIYRCPKIRCLFSSSMGWNFSQFEDITVDSCEMMEEIFSGDVGGETSDSIVFSRLVYLKLYNLPNLIHFCKNMSVDFPRLMDISFVSLQKLRILSPAGSKGLLQPVFSKKVEFGTLQNLEIRMLESATSIWYHLTSPSLFVALEQLVVASCDRLTHLMSHSIAKLLVKLERLTVEDCFVLEHVVIAGDDQEPPPSSSLFPQLRILRLIGLPSLKSFCHGMNELELPCLEDVEIIDCREMTEFCGGKVNMPVLIWVDKEDFSYEINDVHSVQHLFNDKHLFAHNNSSSRSRGREIMEEDLLTEEDFLIIEEGVTDAQKTYLEELGEKREKNGGGGDASSSSYDETSDRGEVEETGTTEQAKPEVSMNEVLDIKKYLDDLILYCLVLPRYYEFTRDILVSQWIVGGLIELGEDQMTEEVCTKCFDALVEMDYFVPSEYDHLFDVMRYRIGDGKKFDRRMRNASEVQQHVSLAFKELGVLKNYRCLQSLVIYDSYGVDHLPSDIFSELKTLKILNLSGTNVAVLPSSIENLKELRFLDMSKTPIRWLPETICYFPHLHTLNLDGCLELERLPKCTNKLINLQHLVVDVSRLRSMPMGMGNLSNLRTLNVFSVGVDDGRRVGELKDLNKLRGSFSLLNLENVSIGKEASEACLYKKVGLRKIELHWRDIQDGKCEIEEEILECLRPPSSTRELRILFYSGGVLPSWICDPSFSELVSIALDDCKYFSSLGSLGELPSLESLSIVENVVLTEIGSSFFGKRANAFPRLEKLSFNSMSKLERLTGFKDGDFPCLRLLIVEYCPGFGGVSFLSRLSSLSGLEIRYCPEFSCLAEDFLPLSLESLMIKQSPKLKAQCCDEQWGDWSKVAQMPSIYIDDQEFLPCKV